MLKKLFALLCAAVLVLSMVSCGSTKTDTPAKDSPSIGSGETAQGESNGEYASEIVMGRARDAEKVDPVETTKSHDLLTVSWNFEGLIYPADDGSDVAAGLADSWEMADDGLSYTFHIRDNANFFDGSPVTAADVVYSLTRAIDPEVSVFGPFMAAIASVEEVDEKTVLINLNEPTPDILSTLTLPSNAIIKSGSEKERGTMGGITAGPYYIDEWATDQYMVFKKNPYYYDSERPKTETIRVIVVPDDANRMIQFENGDLDVLLATPRNSLAQISANPNFKIEAFPSVTNNFLMFNVNDEILKDIKVRQAVAHCINKDSLIKGAHQGYAEKTNSYMDNLDPFRNPDLPEYEFDTAKAKTLLAEANYNDGLKLTIIVNSGDTTQGQMAAILKESFAEAGIDLEVQQYDYATVSAMRSNGEFQLMFSSLGRTGPDSGLTDSFISYFPMAKGLNTGWNNADSNKLYEQTTKEMDAAKRAEMFIQLQQMVYNEVPLVPLYVQQDIYALRTEVEGFRYNLFYAAVPDTIVKSES